VKADNSLPEVRAGEGEGSEEEEWRPTATSLMTIRAVGQPLPSYVY